jgi:hypothetical protein
VLQIHLDPDKPDQHLIPRIPKWTLLIQERELLPDAMNGSDL